MKNTNKGYRYKRNSKKIVILVFLIAAFIMAGTYAGLRIWIRSDINKICRHAMSQNQSDRVVALISVLNSGYRSLKDKNDAIWALEYIGDSRALPVLKSLQTNSVCDHTRYVCQRELTRAINQIEGNRFSIMKFK